ncbi:MAG TPA: DUF2089 domain-containing protein [Acholeplasma sp.]|jgi:hypothetical protein
MPVKKTVITACPVCQHDLHITKLECEHCGTKIEGEFQFSKFNYLNAETLYFIEIFVKNRGNIKAVEKEMNISYPTVKKYLDEAIVSLGYKLDDYEDEEEVKKDAKATEGKAIHIDILDQIKNGQLDVDAAIEKIKKLKGVK